MAVKSKKQASSDDFLENDLSLQEIEGDKSPSISDVLAKIKQVSKNNNFKVLNNTSNISHYSTGNIAVDYLFGCGGIPKGKIVEISGVNSSGKTTWCQMVVASIQKQGKIACWFDIERAFEPKFAERLGVNLDKLLIEEFDCAETVFERLREVINIEELGVIVVDSIAAMSPSEEQGDSKKFGMLAALLSKELRKLTALLNKNSPSVIFINQVRAKFNAGMYEEKDTTTGGYSLPHYASVRLKTSQVGKIKDSKGIVRGVNTQIKVKKNKVGYPFREAIISVDYRNGIGKYSGLFDLLKSLEIIKKGSKLGYYKYKDTEYKADNITELWEAHNVELWEELNNV